jgi:ABC-type multidrug transport system fused ATPase/permease subunit
VSTWRRRISIVSQDIVLFNDTVANNIAFGEDDVTMEKIVSASKMASAHSFIAEMAEGYNTVLGDRGVRLSGGQKQRLAIARAFLSEPDVLIIDEGTSHLDSVTEHEIQKAIESLSQDRTVVIIAHRLSTIKNADKILVMEKGQIIEDGSHDELVKLKSSYWNLLNHQQLDLTDS